ncbi:MAG TPA: TOBE domain-containing protein, partial [Gaiellaceae bacterium]
ESDNGTLAVVLGSQRLALPQELHAQRPALAAFAGRDVVVGIRPEHLEDAALAPDTPADQRLQGRVLLREALGSELVVHLTVDARPAMTEDVRELAEDTGAAELAQSETEATLVGRFGARARVRDGETTTIAVDTGALHFFDPASGLGIYSEAPAPSGAARPA